MEILLLRHGKTRGNLEGRYIGRTDEPLPESSRQSLRQSPYRKYHPEFIYVSPMLRCRETAEILFAEDCVGNGSATGSEFHEANTEGMLPLGAVRDQAAPPGEKLRKTKFDNVIVVEDLREKDFGTFENKNYEELKDEPAYQEWLDSGGTLAFPGGEGQKEFCLRCQRAFEFCLSDAVQKRARKIAFVVHGGTIMAILEKYGIPEGDFYRWQLKNGEGYHCRCDADSEKLRLEIV
ncbi:MAG: histidine phosphatase family protein [Clostridiales bacterium]|nr:histidine phosphatase family protein [Clostridiales bacterium]